MKRTVLTILTICFFALLFNLSDVSAATCQSNGGGEWDNPSTWLCDGIAAVPKPGDFIIISGADIVTISSTVDLTTALDGTPTTLLILGTLKFFSPEGGCANISCDIDLKLDSESEVIIQSENGIQQEGPGPDEQSIDIGGDMILNQFPFGPGNLPENAPLPIKLVYFLGTAAGNSNLLTWETELEVNAKEFVLERSATAREDFSAMGTVAAIGFSETLQSYKFEDRTPLALGYYRLKTVDFDGTFSYSDVISIEKHSGGSIEVDVFPVPLGEEINLAVNSKEDSEAILTITNYLGQQVFIQQLELNKGINKFNFNWNNQGSGVHFITIDNKAERIVKKVF